MLQIILLNCSVNHIHFMPGRKECTYLWGHRATHINLSKPSLLGLPGWLPIGHPASFSHTCWRESMLHHTAAPSTQPPCFFSSSRSYKASPVLWNSYEAMRQVHVLSSRYSFTSTLALQIFWNEWNFVFSNNWLGRERHSMRDMYTRVCKHFHHWIRRQYKCPLERLGVVNGFVKLKPCNNWVATILFPPHPTSLSFSPSL